MGLRTELSLGLKLSVGLSELEIDSRGLLLCITSGFVLAIHLVVEIFQTQRKLLLLLLKRVDLQLRVVELALEFLVLLIHLGLLCNHLVESDTLVVASLRV